MPVVQESGLNQAPIINLTFMNTKPENGNGFDSTCLWAIRRTGNIIQHNCPFAVLTINEVGDLPVSTRVAVTEVKATMDAKIVYIINGKPYYHYNFTILSDLLGRASEPYRPDPI